MDLGGFAFVPGFHHQKEDTKENEHNCHSLPVVKQRVQLIVKEYAHYGSRYAADQHLEPHLPNVFLGHNALVFYTKRPKLVPVQHHYGQNGTQLDHHQEHLLELRCYIQVQKFVHQDHVAGGADRQPLGNALYNTQHNGLEYFNNQIHILYCLPYRFFYCNRPAASCTEIL